MDDAGRQVGDKRLPSTFQLGQPGLEPCAVVGRDRYGFLDALSQADEWVELAERYVIWHGQGMDALEHSGDLDQAAVVVWGQLFPESDAASADLDGLLEIGNSSDSDHA